MSFITDTLFGKEEKQAVSKTGISQLIDQFPELQGVGEDVIAQIVQLSQDPSLFEAVGPTGLEQQGLEGLASAGEGIFKPDFKFGQEADAASTAAAQSLGQVGGVLDKAGGLVDQGTSAITPEEFQAALAQFQNPFEEQVVQTAIGDIREQGDSIFDQLATGAGEAGAFGSTRQGVLEGQAGGEISQAIGDVSGALRSQGFQFAAGSAADQLQNLRGNQLTGAGLTINQAGQLVNTGQAQTQLSGQNMANRQAVQDIQSQQLRDQLNQAQAQLGGGQLERGIATQNQTVPLAQLNLLQSGLNLGSSGSQLGGRQGTEGLFGSGGSVDASGGSNLLNFGTDLFFG